MDAPEHAALNPSTMWDEANRRWLIAAMARLRDRLTASKLPAVAEASEPHVDAIQAPLSPGFEPALINVARTFGLSPFERELLLLLTGLEIDDRLRRAFAAAGGADGRASFGAALALLTCPHWDALSPEAPLRYWRLIVPEPAAALMLAPLRLDERILHLIAGIPASDAMLSGLAIRVSGKAAPAQDLPLARRIASALQSGAVVVLDDGGDAIRRDWALAAAAAYRRDALWIEARNISANPEAAALLARHIDREAMLGAAVPVVNVADGAANEALALAARIRVGMVWLAQAAPGLSALPNGRRVLRIELPRPDVARERNSLLARWRTAHGRDDAVEAQLGRAAAQFRLESGMIDGVLDTVAAASGCRADAVWPAARAAARGGLDALAQRVETRAGFDDIVLPVGQTGMLRDIAYQLRQRERVFRDWGFGERYGLGQSFVALFSGESGTGKTLAAEAIANEAGLDLYRVDLATLVSKYIGETEKNLKQLFDAADASGAVLLFDEADALFGKRSEVKDSHDRYANIEVAYLLQRVEAYRGLAILTTNMKSAIDRAFMRRIRFVVNFPMPDAAARERIWRRQFPAAAPLGAVDFKALAKLNICGGNIRSVALSAAFKAADAGCAIDQALLMTAAHEEAAKLERSLGRDRGRTK
jgi:hypothetical protein